MNFFYIYVDKALVLVDINFPWCLKNVMLYDDIFYYFTGGNL